MANYQIIYGKLTIICAWCGKFLYRKPGYGQSGISSGICPECKKKYFPDTMTQGDLEESGKLSGLPDQSTETSEK